MPRRDQIFAIELETRGLLIVYGLTFADAYQSGSGSRHLENGPQGTKAGGDISDEPMASRSAGILMYHGSGNDMAVLLVHPGGPYWSKRDLGAWSIPKGEIDDGEETENAARREFSEELGVPIHGQLLTLGRIRQRAGKIVYGYALEGNLNVRAIRSNNATSAWPPRSGRTLSFPEIVRADWFAIPLARRKILTSQQPFLDRLEKICKTARQLNPSEVTT